MPSPWSEDASLKKSSNMIVSSGVLKAAFGFLGVLFLLGGGLLLYTMSNRETSTGVVFDFTSPKEILAGESFVLGISISNISPYSLEHARLVVTLPKELAFADQGVEQRIFEETIDSLTTNNLKRYELKLVSVGDGYSVARVNAALTYTRPNSAAEFKEDEYVDLTIGSSAVGLDFDIPEKIVSGQDFDLSIRLRNQTTEAIQNLVLNLNLPAQLILKDAMPATESGTPGSWRLSLDPRETKEFKIKANLTGREDSFTTIEARLEKIETSGTYVVARKSAALSLTSSPLTVEVLVNGGEGYSAQIGEKLVYTLLLKNNSTVPLENVSVKLVLQSDYFDTTSLQTNGFYNAAEKSITWSAANYPSLRTLQPRATQSLGAAIALRPDFIITKVSDKNFALRAIATAESPTVPPGINTSKTEGRKEVQTRLQGRILFTSQAFYKEPTAAILNTGPYPPRVNEITKYTVHWKVSSMASDASEVEVRAILEPYARYNGVSKTNFGSEPLYNPNNGEIVWRISKIPANKGILSPPAELVFQVEVTPHPSHAGQALNILRESTLTAREDFTGGKIELREPALTTDLPFDTSIGGGDRKVQP